MPDRRETLDIRQGVNYDVPDTQISKSVIFMFIIIYIRVLCFGNVPYTRISAYSCL